MRAALDTLRSTSWTPNLAREVRLLEFGLLTRLGDTTYYAGDMPGALGPYRDGAALADAELARAPSLVWTEKKGEAAFNISGTLGDIGGREEEALRTAREGTAILREALSFGPDAAIEMRLLILYGQEALILSAMGRSGEAVEISARGIAIRQQRLSATPGDASRQRDLAVSLASHASALAGIGRRSEACAVARQGQQLWQTIRAQGRLGARDARVEIPKMDKAAGAVCAP